MGLRTVTAVVLAIVATLGSCDARKKGRSLSFVDLASETHGRALIEDSASLLKDHPIPTIVDAEVQDTYTRLISLTNCIKNVDDQNFTTFVNALLGSPLSASLLNPAVTFVAVSDGAVMNAAAEFGLAFQTAQNMLTMEPYASYFLSAHMMTEWVDTDLVSVNLPHVPMPSEYPNQDSTTYASKPTMLAWVNGTRVPINVGLTYDGDSLFSLLTTSSYRFPAAWSPLSSCFGDDTAIVQFTAGDSIIGCDSRDNVDSPCALIPPEGPPTNFTSAKFMPASSLSWPGLYWFYPYSPILYS